MAELSQDQVDFIAEDIRRRGIFLRGLQDDLLDHICCLIENNLGNAMDFRTAYEEVLKDFGENGLQEIQDETTYLLTHKYHDTMRKFMFGSGLTAVVSLVSGAVFKLEHWPGANTLLVFGIGLLTLFFVPLWFSLRLRESSTGRQKLLHAAALVSAILLLLSGLFKIMHWPFAGVLSVSGFVFFFLVYLPAYFISGYRNPVTRYATISNSILMGSCAGILILLSFQSPSGAVSNAFFDSAEKITAQNKTIQASNNARYKQITAALGESSTGLPEIKALKKQFDETCSFVSTIKTQLELKGAGALVPIAEGDIDFSGLNQKLEGINTNLGQKGMQSVQVNLSPDSPTGLALVQLAELENDLLCREAALYAVFQP